MNINHRTSSWAINKMNRGSKYWDSEQRPTPFCRVALMANWPLVPYRSGALCIKWQSGYPASLSLRLSRLLGPINLSPSTHECSLTWLKIYRQNAPVNWCNLDLSAATVGKSQRFSFHHFNVSPRNHRRQKISLITVRRTLSAIV